MSTSLLFFLSLSLIHPLRTFALFFSFCSLSHNDTVNCSYLAQCNYFTAAKIPFCLLFYSPVAVQTTMAPPKKDDPGVLQSSLVHASVSAMQNPMGCDVKFNGHCPLPRLSISSRSASVVASLDASVDGSALHSVMKWKTVVAVFVVVMVYLIGGGLVFQVIERPFETNQKYSITLKKAMFLQNHSCVSPAELEDLIKVDIMQWQCHHDSE